MRDEETGSWWQQVTGEAIQGPLKGQRLRPVFHDELTFALWKREIQSADACCLWIDALATTREKEPFKLIGYVLMPDHFHLLANPLSLDLSIVVGRLKGRAAASILSWLRVEGHSVSLSKLTLPRPLKSGQTHAVWMKEFSAVDIWSRKFIRQKLHYIHMNPVRAGLCKHPAEWRWSSYNAYLPHKRGIVPIEVDQRWLWTEEELSLANDRRTSALSKRNNFKGV